MIGDNHAGVAVSVGDAGDPADLLSSSYGVANAALLQPGPAKGVDAADVEFGSDCREVSTASLKAMKQNLNALR
jgi:hypothetical protein